MCGIRGTEIYIRTSLHCRRRSVRSSINLRSEHLNVPFGLWTTLKLPEILSKYCIFLGHCLSVCLISSASNDPPKLVISIFCDIDISIDLTSNPQWSTGSRQRQWMWTFAPHRTNPIVSNLNRVAFHRWVDDGQRYAPYTLFSFEPHNIVEPFMTFLRLFPFIFLISFLLLQFVLITSLFCGSTLAFLPYIFYLSPSHPPCVVYI